MRQGKLLEWLKNSPYEAIILTSGVNRRYATGFNSSDGVVYISEKRAIFFTDFRYTEAARACVQDFDVREIHQSETYFELINQVVSEDGVICAALENEALTQSKYSEWVEALKVGEICGLGHAMEELREVKDESEVKKIVSAQRIAERAFTEILNDIKPGASEREIAARLTYLMLHYGAENMSFDPIVVSGANSSKPHGVPTEKHIESGDFVTMDFGCICEGYCSDMTRTIAVNHVTDEMRQVYEIVLTAQLAGITRCRAGVTGMEVDAGAREVITGAGYGDAFGHGFGHGVGLEIHEEPTASRRGNKPFKAGCIVTAEPGIYLPGKFGVRIEDMLYVKPDGCENLTKAPKELILL